MAKSCSDHHTSALFDESFAKVILESECNTVFSHSDRPDLIDEKNKIGVEVTSAYPEGYHQAISMMCAEKIISGKLCEMGYENSDQFPGSLTHPVKAWEHGFPFPTFNYLIDGIKAKVEKAKKYKQFNEMRLFVFTDNLPEDLYSLTAIVKKVLEANNNEYCVIYLKYITQLLVINVIKSNFFVKTINDEIQLQKEALNIEQCWLENSNE